MILASTPTISAAIGAANRVLVLAVGGGNDSVSTLLLQYQLAADYGYRPELVDIVAVLPDCLEYAGMRPTPHPLVTRPPAQAPGFSPG